MKINLKNIRKYWNEKYIKDPFYGRTGLSPVFDRLIKNVKPGFVLDLGCGSGTTSLFFAKNGFKVYAIDISDVAIKNLNDEIRKNKLEKNLKAETGDFRKVLKRKYDIIVALGIPHFFKKTEGRSFVNKIKSYTKRGGLNFISAITNKGDFYKFKNNKNQFYVEQDELLKMYGSWNILEYHMGWGDSAQKNRRGKSFRNQLVIMYAKK